MGLFYRIAVNILAIFFFVTNSGGQNQSNAETNCIRHIVEYRSYLLRKNPNATEELRQLFEFWDSLRVPDERRADVTSLVVWTKLSEQNLKSIQSRKDTFRTASEIEFEIILKNAEIMDLLNLGLLQPKYPFKIDPETLFFDEIREYGLDSIQKIAEVGCGTGSFGLVLAKICPKSTIFLNDKEGKYLKYIQSVIDENPEMFAGMDIQFADGTDKTTNLQGKNLDIIIIRNAFHHFSKRKKMLASIKKSLKPNGRLFIKDPIIELGEDVDRCKKALNLDILVNSVQESGFKLVKSTRFEDQMLLEFMVEGK